MPMFDSRCTKCDWCGERLEKHHEIPPCPTCGEPCEHYFANGRTPGIQTDEQYIGGKWIANLGPRPIKVYSNAERLKIMRERGLHEEVEHVGDNPGTDKSRHTTRWVNPPRTPEQEAERIRQWWEDEERYQAELKAKTEASAEPK